MVRTWCGLCILTWTCASRHSMQFLNISTSKTAPELRSFAYFGFQTCFAPQRAHFLNISTSKSAPELRRFAHFDFQACFAPQRVHFFNTSTSKSAPNPSVCNTFDFEMHFAPTTACAFSTSQLSKVLQARGVFNVLASKSASRHNGVQLFISHLPRWLLTRRFSEPTF